MDVSFATLLLVFCWYKANFAWSWHCWWLIPILICSWNVLGCIWTRFCVVWYPEEVCYPVQNHLSLCDLWKEFSNSSWQWNCFVIVDHKLIEINWRFHCTINWWRPKQYWAVYFLRCSWLHVGWNLAWTDITPSLVNNVKTLIYGQKLTQFDWKMHYESVLSELKWMGFQLYPKFIE